MTRYILSLVILIVSMGVSDAMETISDSIAAPEITFVDGITVDMGDVKSGDVVAKKFRLRNTGSAPLEILDIYTGCGCLAAKFSREPVPPGEETEVEITFRSRGYGKGSFLKPVKLRTNAPSRINRIFIKARIRPE